MLMESKFPPLSPVVGHMIKNSCKKTELILIKLGEIQPVSC
jgi:hypothetical protein